MGNIGVKVTAEQAKQIIAENTENGETLSFAEFALLSQVGYI
jgi:hypothetical protein